MYYIHNNGFKNVENVTYRINCLKLKLHFSTMTSSKREREAKRQKASLWGERNRQSDSIIVVEWS